MVQRNGQLQNPWERSIGAQHFLNEAEANFEPGDSTQDQSAVEDNEQRVLQSKVQDCAVLNVLGRLSRFHRRERNQAQRHANRNSSLPDALVTLSDGKE